ncbi:RNA 2',3'-cyclic phosphodiesterase [Deferribacter thermophilus]|uniref:RNA 2',3'-cyclic phosphodiesterase n=1 Tax=Deferribacter thermophilus TaxID=53573 RepID=UPI003C175186
MKDSLRLFIAVKFSNHINNIVEKATLGLANYATLKPVKKENMHVTLAFLGEQKNNKIDQIISSIENIDFGPTKVEFNNFAFFERNGIPAVFYLKGESDTLCRLAEALRNNLKNNKIYYDKKKFIIHLTGARIKKILDKKGLYDFCLKINDQMKSICDEIREIILYKSTLTKEGPIYSPIYIKKSA